MLYTFYFGNFKTILLKMVFATLALYDYIIRNKGSYFSIIYNIKLFYSININKEKHVFLWWKLVVKNFFFSLTSSILDFLGHVVLPGTTAKKSVWYL